MILELKDSQYSAEIKSEYFKKHHICEGGQTALYCQAVDKLRNSVSNKEVEFFSLAQKQNKEIFINELIWYEINNSNLLYAKQVAVVNNATFYTSHYIGFYSTKIAGKTVNIVIKPRFGSKVFNYLLSYAYGIYLPKGSSSIIEKQNSNLWLIVIMFKATLDKAITKSQIPKEYQKISKNLSTYRGQLNISQHIKHNLFDASKFYCDYRKLTMDTTINQTIRYVYKLLKDQGFGRILGEIAEYDLMLESFGVTQKIVNLKEIENIRYSKLNIYYKKVMELSSLIIKSKSKSSDNQASNSDGFSYFLDIAELWENYLLKVLQKNLSEYEVYSPNERGGKYLIEGNYREVRPDIIIEKDGEIVAILDAKYKWYDKLGKTAKDGVSREDLYQMMTYLYNFANNDKPCLGLFISPIKGKEIKVLNKNKKHKIGILNLNIENLENENFTTLEQIKQEELNFIKALKKELNHDPL
ncbi:McrC family protein [Sulfurimonas sp. NW15]|uniref:McrC family protein n=1 Tax=Sulfurimonas sp. NW15 TaxID=2922729 RepID=UPI003DA8F0E0